MATGLVVAHESGGASNAGMDNRLICFAGVHLEYGTGWYDQSGDEEGTSYGEGWRVEGPCDCGKRERKELSLIALDLVFQFLKDGKRLDASRSAKSREGLDEQEWEVTDPYNREPETLNVHYPTAEETEAVWLESERLGR